MNANYIQISRTRDFLICFRGTNEKFIFNTASGFLELLKQFNKYGVEYIKEYDPAKMRFKRVKISSIIACFGYNTELKQDYFNKLSYFKV